MTRLILAFAMVVYLAGIGPAAAESWFFKGGKVFDGSAFVEQDLCVVDGVFALECPDSPDHLQNLEGAYVTSPFAEGHHHTVLFGGWREEVFLKSGIVYTWIMANSSNFGPVAREKYSGAGTMDFSLAMASLTDPAGHPVQIGYNFHDSLEAMEGDWVHTVETLEDVRNKWPAVMATRPDFIKIFLLNSENYSELKADVDFPTRYRGINPDLVKEIVKLAKGGGLRVAAHVRTAHDFHVALEAGVDIMAHTPGFTIGPTEEGEGQIPFLLSDLDHPERFLITGQDAEKAADLGVYVISTLGGRPLCTEDKPCDPLLQRQMDVCAGIQKQNIATLKKAGVTVLIGSDAGEGNSVEEAIALVERGFFSENEALKSLTETTPQAIFPKRKIGRLAPGYEGSLVVLEGNPLDNIENLKSVTLVFKQGNVLFEKDEGQ